MSKVAHYLQEHIVGEVMTSLDVRRDFSTDGSVLSLMPSVVVYPRNENDVRKTARFTWQLAERGRIIPITARGSGTDQSGAALSSGVILAFPAHMNQIVEFDNKSGKVSVEPGINYGKLQQTLKTYGKFLPPYPASIEYSTLGGAVANDAGGEKSIKYGTTRAFVKSLHVVLANGEVIETGRLNKRDLNKKLGLATFEGEIYRAVDTLIEENQKVLDKVSPAVTKNIAGYNLRDVKSKDGFDLTPLFVGSQGTLGIITEISLETENLSSETALIVGMFDDIDKVQQAIIELRKLPDMPSMIEMVDGTLLEMIEEINPNQLKSIITRPFPKVILLVEFDNSVERTRRKMARRAVRILDRFTIGHRVAEDDEQKVQLWKLRQAVSTVITHDDGKSRALPLIDDGIVPVEKYSAFIEGAYKIFKQNHVKATIWGHAGEAHFHTRPFLNLGEVGDRQKLFRIMEEYYRLIIELGGSTTGEYGDGRMRGPYLAKLCGPELYELFEKTKKIFDPYGILNPGVKTGVTLEDIKTLLRHEYSLGDWYEHMPRT